MCGQTSQRSNLLTSQRVCLSNFSFQASAVLPGIRIWLSNLGRKFLDSAQGQAERSEAWPCAESKNFLPKFFFPPRRRSPKQPRRSAKQKLKSFCLADQRGCSGQKIPYQPCRPKPALIQPDCYGLRFLQGGSYPSLVLIQSS